MLGRMVLTVASFATALSLAAVPAALAAGGTERASVNSAGRPANADSEGPSISGAGRYVAFDSLASNLVPGHTSGLYDVYVHDRKTGATVLASPGLAGTLGNAGSAEAVISRNGRFVAFSSVSTNLVPGDTNGKQDVFVRDLKAGTTVRVSVGVGGRQANGDSLTAAISANGRFVLFTSKARNLPTAPGAGRVNLFVRDLKAETTTLEGPGDHAESASITPNGRYLAFDSDIGGIVAGHPPLQQDVYLRDRRKGRVSLVSVARDGGFPDGASYAPFIADVGTVVAFTSMARKLVADTLPSNINAFVRDLAAGTTVPVLAPDGSPPNAATEVQGLSADGRYLLLSSFATNLVPADTNDESDLFVQDRLTRNTVRVDVSTAGRQANGPTFHGVLSADGRHVAFTTEATNLVSGSVAGGVDVLVHSLEGPGVDARP